MNELKIGSSGEEVRKLKVALNKRLVARGLSTYKADEKTKTLRTKDMQSVAKALWALGAAKSTYDNVLKTGTVTSGGIRMIRNPGKRNERQLRDGQIRMANMRKHRKELAEKRKRGGNRQRAVSHALSLVGHTEHPPPANSDRGGIIDSMQRYWGFGHVAWCGIFVGYNAEKFGNLTALRSDVASVAAIERHARNHDPGYGRWQSSVVGCLPGAFVVIGGSGVHVAKLVEAHSDGSADTVEGNTSFGPGGSQSNGGCVAKRHRSDAEIYGCATMDYPN